MIRNNVESLKKKIRDAESERDSIVEFINDCKSDVHHLLMLELVRDLLVKQSEIEDLFVMLKEEGVCDDRVFFDMRD